MATLYASPSQLRPNQTHLVIFTYAGGTWASAPTITPSGLAGVVVGTVTLLSPTTASALVTYGTAIGVVTFTEGTGGATFRQQVGALRRWAPHRRGG